MEENFIMRMSTDDRELLDKLSEFLGESKSTVVRMSLREQAQRYGLWPQRAQPNPHAGGVWPWADEDVHSETTTS